MSDHYKRWTVLASVDHGLNWRRHQGIRADDGPRAMRRVKLGYPDVYGNDALFHAVLGRFKGTRGDEIETS